MTRETITKHMMFEPVLASDPSFLPRWNDWREDYCEEPEPLYYLALASLAQHVVDKIAAKDIANLDKIFALVEAWHIDGDTYVRQAATVGFLEALQNHLSHRDDYESLTLVVEPWLQPESKRWWDKLTRFWEGDIRALRNDD